MAPDEEVVPDNRFVRIVTKDGTTVTGKLLNQDATSIQMMNPKEELKPTSVPTSVSTRSSTRG